MPASAVPSFAVSAFPVPPFTVPAFIVPHLGENRGLVRCRKSEGSGERFLEASGYLANRKWCAQSLVHTMLFGVHHLFLVYAALFGVHKSWCWVTFRFDVSGIQVGPVKSQDTWRRVTSVARRRMSGDWRLKTRSVLRHMASGNGRLQTGSVGRHL